MTMTKADTARIARLARLSALVRDARLAEFGKLAAQRAEIERALDSLAVPPVLGPETLVEDDAVPRPAGTPVPLPAAVAHTRWVLAERARQLSALSRLRAAEAPLRDAAARATGRAEVLDRIAKGGRG